jgi:hypothetical protein
MQKAKRTIPEQPILQFFFRDRNARNAIEINKRIILTKLKPCLRD